MTNAGNLARQIGIVQAAAKISLDPDPTANAAVMAAIAGYLDQYGTTDIRNMREYLDSTLNFFYDVATAHVYVNAESDSASLAYTTTQYSDAGPVDTDMTATPNAFMLWQSQHTIYNIFCVMSRDNFPVFYAYASPRISGWTDALHGVVFLVGFVVSVAFPALAQTIGTAVLGADLAAEYPLLASAVGNVCINTTLSGGNVQGAVASAVVSGAGTGVGGVVATASDSAIIGQVANAVTKAAITGGSIQTAALQSLAGAGLSSIGTLPTFSGANMQLGDDTSSDDELSSSDVASLYSDAGYGSTGVDTSQISSSDLSALLSGGGYGDALTAPNPAISPAASPGGVVASSGGLNLTALAAAALPLITAYVRAGSPPVMTSNGSVTANANGTLTNAAGAVTTMPVGTPYLTSAGVVTNNGNGTYSVVGPSGTITTQSYPPGTSGAGIANALSNLGTPALIGIALLAYLALK